MGRKSNTKKIARKLVKEEESKELEKKAPFKKKSKKEIKKEATKKAKKISDKKTDKNTKKTEKKTEQKSKKQFPGKKTTKATKEFLQKNQSRIFAGLFALIMIGLLVWVGVLLFQKVFRAQPIAKYLPAENTVATLEININPGHHQVKKTFELLQDYPEYSEAKLREYIESRLEIDIEKDLSLWVGRSVGVAVMNFEDKYETTTVGFAEFISKSNMEDFLSRYNPNTTKHEGHTVFTITMDENTFYLTTIEDYLFGSISYNTITNILDARMNRTSSLYNSARYRRIDNNIPLNKIAFLYINYEAVTDSFFSHFPFLGELGVSTRNLQSLMGFFKAEGISFIATDKNFVMQSFLSLSDSVVEEAGPYLSSQQKYQAELVSYISPEVSFFWGGENLNNQIQKFIGILSGGEINSMRIFNKVIQGYVEKYFGATISFEEDIVPLISKEYLFVVENIGEEDVYKFIFRLDERQSSAIKVHELAENFAEIGAVFEPKVVEHILEDGTVSREIMAIPKKIVKSEFKHGNNTIFQLNMGEEDKNIFYTIVDQTAFISTSVESIKQSMNLFAGANGSFAETEEFANYVEPIIKSSDEVAYIKPERILPIFFEGYNFPEALDVLSSLSSGRNYFYDGIVTINNLHIK
jgi:hypothetical protein